MGFCKTFDLFTSWIVNASRSNSKILPNTQIDLCCVVVYGFSNYFVFSLTNTTSVVSNWKLYRPIKKWFLVFGNRSSVQCAVCSVHCARLTFKLKLISWPAFRLFVELIPKSLTFVNFRSFTLHPQGWDEKVRVWIKIRFPGTLKYHSDNGKHFGHKWVNPNPFSYRKKTSNYIISVG